MNAMPRITLTMLAAVACATVARAQPPFREATQTTIITRDVNFHDPKAVAALDERLRLAALKVCDSGDSKRLDLVLADRKCARASWEAAVRSIDAPMLSQLHGQNMILAANK
jgi:UrcA family protein